jgi:hypothetical protein
MCGSSDCCERNKNVICTEKWSECKMGAIDGVSKKLRSIKNLVKLGEWAAYNVTFDARKSSNKNRVYKFKCTPKHF